MIQHIGFLTLLNPLGAPPVSIIFLVFADLVITPVALCLRPFVNKPFDPIECGSRHPHRSPRYGAAVGVKSV
jgi:hypothetical protein